MNATERTLRPGDAAPALSLIDQAGNPVSVNTLRGSKVIIYFYPAAFTPGCTTQACDFRDNLGSLAAAGYRVVGVSTDDRETLERFAAQDQLDFTLASDPSGNTAREWGAWGEKDIQGKTVTGVLRSTFALDEAGNVTLAQYRVEAAGHVSALRTALGIA
ncbi:thioredoxin-dependent thiol peroxidase [Leucobacter sp. HY1908]